MPKTPSIKPIDPQLGWNTYRAILGHEPTVDPEAETNLPEPPRHMVIKLPMVHMSPEMRNWFNRVGRQAMRRLEEAKSRLHNRAA